MHIVEKPFDYAADGIRSRRLAVGEEIDFGVLAEGLKAEGFIKDAPVPVSNPTGETVPGSSASGSVDTAPGVALLGEPTQVEDGAAPTVTVEAVFAADSPDVVAAVAEAVQASAPTPPRNSRNRR